VENEGFSHQICGGKQPEYSAEGLDIGSPARGPIVVAPFTGQLRVKRHIQACQWIKLAMRRDHATYASGLVYRLDEIMTKFLGHILIPSIYDLDEDPSFSRRRP